MAQFTTAKRRGRLGGAHMVKKKLEKREEAGETRSLDFGFGFNYFGCELRRLGAGGGSEGEVKGVWRLFDESERGFRFGSRLLSQAILEGISACIA